MTIEATLFDMDGLLIDSEVLWHEAEIEIFGGLGVDIGEATDRSTKGLFVAEVVDYWYVRYPWSGPSNSEVVDTLLARVGELGLQHGINYKQRDYVQAIKDLTSGEGVDTVFEMLGGEHVGKSVRCVRDFGRVIVYGSATGEIPQLDTRLLYAKGASVHGLWLSYLSANRPLMESAWKQLSEWLAAGKLLPVIGKVFPLEQAREAYTLMQEGKNYGKIVLKIS